MRTTGSTVHSDGRRVRVSVALQTDKSTATYRQLARGVEDLGFDGLSVFADLGYQPPLPALVAAAAVTSRIRLGVAGYSPAMLHPVEIAGQLAVLDEASGGRGYLGLVRGSWLDRIGLSAGGGLRRLTEAVTVIQQLLTRDTTGFHGEYYVLAEGFALRYPLPGQLPDLLIGTWSPATAAMAAGVAREVKLGGCTNPAMVAMMAGWLRAAVGRHGRPPGVVAGAVTVVDEDGAAARARARTEVAMYLDVVAGLDRTVQIDPELLRRMRSRLDAGDTAGAGELISSELLALFAFAGTPADIIGQCEALMAAGVGRIEFGTPHGLTDAGGIELLGRQVLPALRAGDPGDEHR